ncbi:MAG: PAS domain-containing protein, partial [Burkholderiales bacterium]
MLTREELLAEANTTMSDGVPPSWQRRGNAAVQARQALLQLVETQQGTEATLRLRDSALGAISQGVLIADVAGRTTYANRACEEITGYSADEMIGRTASMLQGAGTNPQQRQALRATIADAVPFQGELLNYRKDGSKFWNELSVTPVFDAGGRPTQFVGVMRDVTARRHADAELSLASKLFEQSSEGFMVTDADGRILKLNRAFTAITGYGEAEVLGQNPRLLASGRHDAAFYRTLWHELKTHGGWQGEIWNRCKDGSVCPHWLSMSRVVDDTGQDTNYIAAFQDITQRKQAEDSIWRLAHFDP